ncbi:MAG: ATP-binding cassette domain-containing protein [Chloroflexi bacterium]|nr:ATP-binding cassette domain-containing protein [Chloroflexota bacterium]
MSARTTAGLHVERLTVMYGPHLALDDACLTCERGQVVGLLGPNGSGKSTLLKAVLGLTRMQNGRITLDGAPLDRRARARIAYTPQRNEVDWSFPITVEEVVVLGRQGLRGLFGRPHRSDWRIAWEALDQLGIGELRRRQIGELSAGQQQRVFIARALAQDGDVLLLDEPLTGVDAQTQTIVLHMLTELRRRGRAVLVTTHDLTLAGEICDCVCLLNTRVIALGAPAHVLTPRALLETFGGDGAVRLLEGMAEIDPPDAAEPRYASGGTPARRSSGSATR